MQVTRKAFDTCCQKVLPKICWGKERVSLSVTAQARQTGQLKAQKKSHLPSIWLILVGFHVLDQPRQVALKNQPSTAPRAWPSMSLQVLTVSPYCRVHLVLHTSIPRPAKDLVPLWVGSTLVCLLFQDCLSDQIPITQAKLHPSNPLCGSLPQALLSQSIMTIQWSTSTDLGKHKPLEFDLCAVLSEWV